MDAAERLVVLHRLLDLVARRGTTLAEAPYENRAAVYVDPARWAVERERVFRSLPLVAGFSAELDQPNAWAARDLGGVPVLLVRGDDGGLRAFLNVCRHRGSPVAIGCGTGTRFMCPFHGWTYDGAGRLVGVPGREGFRGVDLQDLSLAPLPVVERHGLMFVRLDPAGAPIDVDDWLGDLGPRLAAWGLGSYRFVGTKLIDARLNWKSALDTYTEGYHFATVHRDTVAQFQLSDCALVETFGPHHRLVFPAHSLTTLRDTPADGWEPLDHFSTVHGLFPNCALSVTRSNAEIFTVYPGREVGHCITQHHYAAPAFADELLDVHQMSFGFSHELVEREDYGQATRVYDALATGLQSTVIYGRNEPALQHLHRGLAALAD